MVANPPEYFGLAGAARRFCVDGKPVHPSTVFRWMRNGILRGRHRVRLGHVRMGRRLCTTAEQIDAFMRNLAAADTLPPVSEPRQSLSIKPSKRSDAQRQRALRKAESELIAARM